MTSIDTEHFRHALLEEKQRVEHALATLRDEHPARSTTRSRRSPRRATTTSPRPPRATLGREIDYTLGDNAEQVLSEIDAALGRIDDRTYGICFNCGNEIPRERLEANPWASLCIDCKRRAEGG